MTLCFSGLLLVLLLNCFVTTAFIVEEVRALYVDLVYSIYQSRRRKEDENKISDVRSRSDRLLVLLHLGTESKCNGHHRDSWSNGSIDN